MLPRGSFAAGGPVLFLTTTPAPATAPFPVLVFSKAAFTAHWGVVKPPIKLIICPNGNIQDKLFYQYMMLLSAGMFLMIKQPFL
jgi:hypothetical protein